MRLSDEFDDILIDMVSDTLPFNDVREVNLVITEGRKYSEILEKMKERYMSDENFRVQIKLRKDIKEAVTDTDILAFREMLDEIHRECIDHVRPAFKIHKYIKWAAVASLLFFAVYGINIYYRATYNTPENVFNKFYTPYPKNAVNYKSNDDVLRIAMDKYHEGRFGEAVVLFNKLPHSIEIESQKLFYLGLSFMEINELNDAIEQFEQLADRFPKSSWASRSRWYLALSYLNTNKIEKAKEMFSTIADNKYYNCEKARKVLRRMD